MSGQHSNGERAERIARQQAAILADGRCGHCSPRRGENEPRSTNMRYVDGKKVPRKGKDKK
jgi:hypothetical protein